MELHLSLRPRGRWAPDWTAAAVAGFAAGAMLMVLELLWAALLGGDGPWRTSQLVAALSLGAAVAEPGSGHLFDPLIVSVALLTHYGLGVLFGLVVGVVMTVWAADTGLERATGVGVAFGTALYLVDFHLLTVLFPWMVELRGGITLFAHLAFGLATALLYRRLARRGAGGAAPRARRAS